MNRLALTAALAATVAAGSAQAQERRGLPSGGGDRAQAAPAGAAAAAPVRQNGGAAGGSFQQSCRNTTTANGRVFSECRGPDGGFRRSSIEYGKCQGDIGNQNGILACNGAVAQDGGVIAEAPAATRNGAKSRNGGDAADSNRGSASFGDGGAGDRYRDQNRGYHGGANQGGYNNGGYSSGPSYNGGGYTGGGYGAGGYPLPRAAQGGYESNGYGGRGDDGRSQGRGRPALVLYDGYNFAGQAFEVYGDVDDLKSKRFNDRARSVRVYSGRWKLCREASASRCEHVRADVPDLRTVNAADQISSIQRE